MIEVLIDEDGKRYVNLVYVHTSPNPNVEVIARRAKDALAEQGVEVDYVAVRTHQMITAPKPDLLLEDYKRSIDKEMDYELPDDRQFAREQERDAKRNYQMQQERKYRSAYRHAYTHVWRNHAANSNKYKPIKIRKR